MLKVAIFGANGRMGQALIEAVAEAEDLAVSAALVRVENTLAGRDVVGADALSYTTDVTQALSEADVALDFTLPEATAANAAAAAEAGTPLVCGTTGLAREQRKALEQAARSIPVVYARNMSVGVNLALDLVARAAKVLGPDYDVEILEAHHRHKQDAPSGTALALGEAVADAQGRDFEAVYESGRAGRNGPRGEGSIGIASLRAGEIVGEHSVLFVGGRDRLEIRHQAQDRRLFADGALRAVRWVADQNPGLYGLGDVLGL